MKILKWLRWRWFCYQYHYCPKHAVPAIYTCLKCVEEREERLKAYIESQIERHRRQIVVDDKPFVYGKSAHSGRQVGYRPNGE